MTHADSVSVAPATLLLTLALHGAGPALADASPDPPVPEEWLTPAETSGFRSTPDYAETLDFLRRLEQELPEMRLQFYGVSAQGRPLPLVVVSRDRAFSPGDAARTRKPIVMIQNGIHAGEIDGKDASLMILRDLALGRHPAVLDAAILLILPIYNVDGHERISPYNRPNQHGPVDGMGFRTTTSGLDLNRDHLKLASQEAQAMIRLFNRWRPHLHVDNHVTDGSDHDWVLTYSWAEAPQVAPSVDAWMKAHMPAVLQATEQAGHRVGPYVGLIDRSDPAQGFNSMAGEPRYSSGYYPLRNRVSILVENQSYKPYRERVLANRDFLLALIGEIGRDPAGLVQAVFEAERRTVALGKPDAAPSRITLRYKTAEPDRIVWPVYEWYSEPSTVMGVPMIRYRDGGTKAIEVPWIHRVEPEATLQRPRGYLVQPGWPVIEARLRGHGLRVRRLTRPAEVEVEAIWLANPEYAERSYQGLTRVTVEATRRVEQRSLPAGTLWIPADQPDFEVAVQLLEPEAPDSLVGWGLLSSVMEQKEYIEPRVLEGLALEMLKDPAVAAEWKKALEDEAFAKNPRARYMWWYRRTPYWDEQVGLLPVMRLMRAAPLETEAWHGPQGTGSFLRSD